MKNKALMPDDLELLTTDELLDVWEDAASRRTAIDFHNCDQCFQEWHRRHGENFNERAQGIVDKWMRRK